jgi:hypothetical protein
MLNIREAMERTFMAPSTICNNSGRPCSASASAFFLKAGVTVPEVSLAIPSIIARADAMLAQLGRVALNVWDGLSDI